MAQTKAGALKIAAQKAGVSVTRYLNLVAQGQKFCYKCQRWKPVDLFNANKSRYDGKEPVCKLCRNGPLSKSDKLKLAWRKRKPSFVPPMKGKKMSEQSRAKMSAAAKHRAQNQVSPLKGRRLPAAVRHKISVSVRKVVARGKDHYAYSHGKAQRNLDARRTVEYKDWRDAIFQRDNYTCRKCGNSKGGNLRAHHIKPFASHPALRFDISNGITLCHTCHELAHYKPDSIRNQRKLKRGERLYS